MPGHFGARRAVTLGASRIPLRAAFVTRLLTATLRYASKAIATSPPIGTSVASVTIEMRIVEDRSRYAPVPLPSTPAIGARIATLQES